jgi:hypothetical protein
MMFRFVPGVVIPLLGILACGQAFAEDEVASPGVSGVAESAMDAADATSASDYREYLKTVESDVSALKERVFRSKATLELLREIIVEGTSVGSTVRVVHVNKMGGGYQMEAVQYFLDGRNIYNRVDPQGSLNASEMREFDVVSQALPVGPHALQVNITLRGNGLGVFSYLKAYSFKVRSTFEFEVVEGSETEIRVVADERGGPWTDYTKRPFVKYDENKTKARNR